MDVELYAIKEALLLVKREATRPETISVRIFIDCQRALRLLQHPSTEGSGTLQQIHTTTGDLSRIGKPISLYWTPGYQDILRNYLVDQVAKKVVNQPTSRDNTISLLYIKKGL